MNKIPQPKNAERTGLAMKGFVWVSPHLFINILILVMFWSTVQLCKVKLSTYLPGVFAWGSIW